MSQQFGRTAAVSIFKRQEMTGSDGTQQLMNIDNEGVQFRSLQQDGSDGLRIGFQVQKATGPVPFANPCVITIYNLGPQSRALASQFNNFVVLQAGYGNNLQDLFKGNILSTITKKTGSDYVTEIQVVDGAFAFQNSMVNLSYGSSVGGASVSQLKVVNDLVAQLKTAGINPGVIKGVPDSPFNNGVVVSGKVTDKLREICDKNNLSFSIQDNQVTIVPFGSSKSDLIISISPDTGLVGIPEIRDLTAVSSATALETNTSDSASSKNKAPRVSFRCLLNPQIGCHQKIALKSKFVNGTYTTTLVSHQGDTYTADWYTNCEAS